MKSKIFQFWSGRWRGEGGYREVLVLAIPLILSTGAWAVQHFVDRMFLAWHSPEALAAAMPAGALNFAFVSLFLGTAIYVNTFVAQFFGAELHDRIGPALWQGVYVGLIAGLLHLLLIPLAGFFFGLAGHAPHVQKLEIDYFQILCLGTGPMVASSAMAGFFSGRGRTWPVMWVSLAATVVNIILDYVMIFGHWGVPALGIKGAAAATDLSACFSFFFYLFLISLPRHNRRFRTLTGWRLDISLFKRLLRFGLPNGVQFFLDMVGFTTFILLVGRLGTVELAATNIAFNINNIAFMPMLGCGMAVSVLVGQNLGKNRPDLAERSVYSGFQITLVYMAGIAAAYVLTPGIFIWPFAAQADAVSFASIHKMTVILLRFVALYCLFDTMNIIFASGVKGAGDTRFVMFMVIAFSLLGLALPTYITLGIMNRGLYTAWTIFTIWVCLLGIAFLFRFLGGKWKSMSVIEMAQPTLPGSIPGRQVTANKP
ncbi:MAG: MATE family efflux transporter [Deltaproteobacteria bacterium]|nr:MATE family efflux transporter [Deltaproteobacteria bacterium]MBW2052703.1 MATE family efflux transporter [Deltaproteobacteria bacterium]MBW2140919.1 MATE family efflux transporter [Deltaproteobacteria bacterium]MBW2324003.1 MATE family efflux transporter [Deltaproteobacteria bacterium]